MSDEQLDFGMPTPTGSAPVRSRAEPPDWLGKGATHAQTMRALRGFHPTGAQLHADEALRCGGCAHAVRRHHGKVYWKCGLDRARWTSGPGTDIRAKWRACARFEPEAR